MTDEDDKLSPMFEWFNSEDETDDENFRSRKKRFFLFRFLTFIGSIIQNLFFNFRYLLTHDLRKDMKTLSFNIMHSVQGPPGPPGPCGPMGPPGFDNKKYVTLEEIEKHIKEATFSIFKQETDNIQRSDEGNIEKPTPILAPFVTPFVQGMLYGQNMAGGFTGADGKKQERPLSNPHTFGPTHIGPPKPTITRKFTLISVHKLPYTKMVKTPTRKQVFESLFNVRDINHLESVQKGETLFLSGYTLTELRTKMIIHQFEIMDKS